MKDIDFDELDRAVSSVLGQAAPGKESAAGVPETTAPAAAAVPTVPAEAAAKTPTLTTPRATRKAPSSSGSGLAVKRRGRFMDVMHPSATMVPSAAANAKPALTEHVSSPLQPLTPDLKESPAPVAESTEAPLASTMEAPAEPIAELDESQALIGAEPAPAENPVKTETKTVDVPDETAAANTEEKAEDDISSPAIDGDLDNVVDATEPEATTDAPSPQGLAASVPQETPFLTDTKVDKRPLGGFGAAMPEAVADEAQDTQTAPTVTLPRELQSDVVEVESLQDDSATPAEDAPLYATNVGAAPEQDDDGRVEGHPLFDTSTYHEPIAAAHESTVPVWLKWLLGLAICLGLGAGVGYFLFTAGL